MIPTSLLIKPPVRTSEGDRIAEKASRSFVSARIRQSYVNKQRLRRESSEMRSRLAEL